MSQLRSHVLTVGAHAAVLACFMAGAAVSAPAQVQFEPERGPLTIPKDCRFEPDKDRCAAENRAIEFCRKEKDANLVHACLRANQPPLGCETKKSDGAKQRCERINRVYQPCKGKHSAELATCVDQHRLQEKRKK